MWPAVKRFFKDGEELFAYLTKEFERGEFDPKFLVIHNTAAPSLAQWGSTKEETRMVNLEHYYRVEKHWSGGPHFFVSPKGIWLFNPLTHAGVHSPSFNKSGIGIEMVGDFQRESFDEAVGAMVQRHTVDMAAALSHFFDLDTSTIKFHKEDPATTHKTCPGKNVKKPALVAKIKARKLEFMAKHPKPKKEPKKEPKKGG